MVHNSCWSDFSRCTGWVDGIQAYWADCNTRCRCKGRDWGQCELTENSCAFFANGVQVYTCRCYGGYMTNNMDQNLCIDILSALKDETGHRVAGKRAWIWILLSSTIAVFFAKSSRSKKVATEILGPDFSGILLSDRYNAYLWVSRRQLCWAHLIRDFTKLVDARGLAADFSNPILEHVQKMFSLWHKFKAGEIDRLQLQEQTQPICTEIERRLELGKTVPLAEALCRSLSELKESLWTFIHEEAVEPTNNDAERTVRKWVIWRKTSFGTQTEKGNEFVERILTVVATCKRQNRKVFDYLLQAMTDHLHGRSAQSLLPDRLA